MIIMGQCSVILFFLVLNLGNVAPKKAKIDQTFQLLESVPLNLSDFVLTPNDMKHDNITDYDPQDSDATVPVVAKHSPCPWKYQKVVNNNRIPKTVIQAVCESSQCRVPSNMCGQANAKKQLTRLSMTTSKCQPIKYYRWVKVLQEKSPKKRKSKKNKYTDHLLPITVGCTCAYTPIEKSRTLP